MRERVEEIETITKGLPPTPAAKKAIEAGAEEVHRVAKEAIENNTKVAPHNRFGLPKEN
jgi:hypothetical protein